jgi:hypothetical protein
MASMLEYKSAIYASDAEEGGRVFKFFDDVDAGTCVPWNESFDLMDVVVDLVAS